MPEFEMKHDFLPAIFLLAAGAALLVPGLCGTTRPMHFVLPEILLAGAVLSAIAFKMRCRLRLTQGQASGDSQ